MGSRNSGGAGDGCGKQEGEIIGQRNTSEGVGAGDGGP